MALRKIMKGGYATKVDLAAFRRSATNKTGWNTKRLDAWLAQQTSAGHLRTPMTNTAGKRHDLEIQTLSGPAREQEITQMKVKGWIKANTEGEVSVAHMKTMKANLRGKNGSGMAIEATLASLEAQKEITIEDRMRKKGGGERRGWRNEAIEWARERGWKMTALTLPQPTPISRKETVVVEMGTGWEGATEGLKQSFDRVISMDAKRQTTRKGGGKKSVPDLLMTFQKAATHPKGAAIAAASLGGAKKGELAAIWASPSCVEFSVAQSQNKGRGVGAGPYAGATISEEEMNGIRAVLDAIRKARAADPTIQYCVENPALSAMADLPEIKETLGEPITVSACAWGERKSGKKYLLWLSPETRSLFHPIDPASAESRCEDCKQGRKHSQAYQPKAGSGQARVNIPGKTVNAARNRVPPHLAAHVGLMMRTARLEMEK
jgi:hypothetical protein